MAGIAAPNIVKDGLVFLVDAANPRSWTGPDSSNVNDLISTNTGSIFNDTSGSYGDNNSFDLDGTDDYIDLGNVSSLNGVTQATWFVWMKKSTNTSSYPIGTWGNPASSSTKQFTFYTFSTSIIAVYMATSSGSQKTMFQNNSLSINQGVWYCLAFVYNESESSNADKLKFYLDGVQIANTVAGAALTSLNSVTTSFQICPLGLTPGPFNGNIGPLQVYNKALSASEVAQNYNALKSRFGL